jgi:hypothetical protein
MNGRQSAIIGAGVAIITLLLLFPPWYVAGKGSHLGARISRGYHFLFSPPCCDPHIDFARYLVPIGVVCLMTLLAYLEMKETRRRGDA